MTRARVIGVRSKPLVLIPLLFLTAALVPPGVTAANDDRASPRDLGPLFQVSIPPGEQVKEINTTTHAVFFTLSVLNTGDQSGDAALDVDGLPEGWSFVKIAGGRSIAVSQVGIGEHRDVVVKVATPPFEKAGTHELEVEVTPADNVRSSIVLTAVVPQFFGVDLVQPLDVETDRGIDLSLSFLIRNTGNGDDIFELYRVDLPGAGWLYTIGGGNRTATVKAQLQTQKVITVTVPRPADSTLPGKCGVTLSVSIRSDHDSRIVDGVSMCIKVRQQYDISFTPDEGLERSTGPDEQVDFPFTLGNVGNGFDVISVMVEHSLDWQIHLTHTEFNLSRDIRRTVVLSVVPLATTTKGEYFLTLTARSSGPIESPLSITHTIKVVVTQKFAYSAAIDAAATGPRPPIPPGGVGEYILSVANEGNGPDTVSLSVLNTPVGWFTTFDQEEVSVLPGKPKDVVLTVQVSTRNDEAVARLYLLTVRAVSDGNRTQVLEQNVSVDVAPQYQLGFTIDGEDTVSANPYERANYNHIFTLENLGNTKDDVQLLITRVSWGPEIGITPSLATVNKELGAFGVTKVQLALNVPTDTPLDTYSLDVTAQSQHDPAQRITQTVHLRIVQENIKVQPIQFKLGTQQDSAYTEWSTYLVEQGNKVQMRMVVQNNGSQSVYNVNVKVSADGKMLHEENITTLGVLETYELTVTFDATFLGQHRILLRADLPGDVSRTDNEAVSVIDVREDIRSTKGGGSADLFRAGSPLFVVFLVLAIILAVFVVKAVSGMGRRTQRKEVYAAIYGQGQAPAEQVAESPLPPPPPPYTPEGYEQQPPPPPAY